MVRQRLLTDYYGVDSAFRTAVSDLSSTHADVLRLLDGLGDLDFTESFGYEHIVTLANLVLVNRLPLDEMERATQYSKALYALGGDWGLDRLPEGIDYLHQQAISSARGEPVWGQSTALAQSSPTVNGTLQIPATELVWHYQEETATEARARLVGLIDNELNRIAEQILADGYSFPDNRPQEFMHLRWLFQHIAHHETYPEIAEKDGLDRSLEASIRRQVHKLAKRANIRLSD